jgi:hypothetical protein
MFEQQHGEPGLQVARFLCGLLAVALLAGLAAMRAKDSGAGNAAFLSVAGAGLAFLIVREVLYQRARTSATAC